MLHIAIVILALSLTAPLGGCDFLDAEKSVERKLVEQIEKATGENGDVDVTRNSITVRVKDTEIKLTGSEDGPVAEGRIPAALPIPDSAHTLSYIRGVKADTINLSFDGALNDVSAKYTELLEIKGYVALHSISAKEMFSAGFDAPMGEGSLSVYAYKDHPSEETGLPSTKVVLVYTPAKK